MTSLQHGKIISRAEIVHISSHGIWVHVDDREYFMPYEHFPWFRRATVDEICSVELLHGHHLHWPALDVDLELQNLINLEQYPLVSRA